MTYEHDHEAPSVWLGAQLGARTSPSPPSPASRRRGNPDHDRGRGPLSLRRKSPLCGLAGPAVVNSPENVGAHGYGLERGPSKRARTIPCSCFHQLGQATPVAPPSPDALDAVDQPAIAPTVPAHLIRQRRRTGMSMLAGMLRVPDPGGRQPTCTVSELWSPDDRHQAREAATRAKMERGAATKGPPPEAAEPASQHPLSAGRSQFPASASADLGAAPRRSTRYWAAPISPCECRARP
jgi:hypothetical protein